MAVQSVQISVKPRSELGSRANRRLRQAGFIPGIVYGHKEAVVPITLPKKQMLTHLEQGVHVLDLELEGKAEKVLVKDVQYDHLGAEVLHVDFARVSLDEKVEVTVPLELRGTPKGEQDGGVLQQMISDIEIECLVTDIPDVIRHSVSDMGLDAVLHISDLQLPPGVKALQEPDVIVATVREVIEAEPTEAAEAETAEPEVIGRKAAEEEEAEEKK
jgi:large subunit ribosomal protein L25